MGAQFLSLSANETFDLQSMIPVGDDPSSVSIQTLNSAGGSDQLYGWDNSTKSWYIATEGALNYEEDAVGVEIKQGDGIWVQGDGNHTLQTSGKVATEPVEIQLISGGKMVINPFLEKVDIQQCIPVGDDPSSVSIQTLNSAGGSDQLYGWDNSTKSWYIATEGAPNYEEDAVGVYIESGKGIWVEGALHVLVIDVPKNN